MAFLLVENGPRSGLRHEIDAPRLVLGRHPRCDVVVDVGAVSRRHAQITRAGDSYYIEDLNSRNGTYLNERPLQGSTLLAEGDRIRICDVTYAFHTETPFVPPGFAAKTSEDSTHSAVLLDDEHRTSGATIMSKLDVRSAHGSLQMAASAEVKLASLVNITRSLGRALSLDEVLPQVLKSLFKIFVQADRGFIVLKEKEGRLVPRWTEVRRKGAEDTIRISRTIVNQVIDSQEAILSADAATDERFDMSESIADFHIRSMMCAPLIDLDGHAFGVLQIDTLDQRNRFQAGDLEVLASIASQAAIAINNAQLYENALHQKEVDRDLKLAHQVQRSFLPEYPPQIENYQFFNHYAPANFVGGDYFDYISMPDGRLAIVVADVVGHGVAAALLMAKLSAEVRFSLASELRPASAMTRLNRAMVDGRLEDRFVTLVMAVLNPTNHEVTIVNAGHMAPMLRDISGTVENAGEQQSGLPLGIIEQYEYEQYQTTITPGTTLTLYTDGINEAQNHEGKQYSIQRIRKQVTQAGNTPQIIGQNIVEDVQQFIGQEPPNDDMCLVCVGRIHEPDPQDDTNSQIDLDEPIQNPKEKASPTSIF